jgi:DNA replication protein DnaC
MNSTATLEKLNIMKMYGMAEAYRTIYETNQVKDLTIDELLAYLVDSEYDDKTNRKINRLIKQAKFKYNAFFQQIDFSADRTIDKNLILRLKSCNWIKERKNIIITGPTGVGKSFIASALGHTACEKKYKVFYYNSQKLFTSLLMSKADGSYEREINKIRNKELFILDDFGLKHLNVDERLSLLEIIEDRNTASSTIIISQVPVNKWHDIIGDETIADAICDRLLNNSYKIILKGKSLRGKLQNK